MKEKLRKKFIKYFLIYQISLFVIALIAIGENNRLALISYAHESTPTSSISTIKEIEAMEDPDPGDGDVPTSNNDYEVTYLFKFSGLPKDVKYEGYKSIKISFEFIGQFIAFLLSLVFNVIKLAIIGWVLIFESIIESVMKSVTGKVLEEEEPEAEPTP